MAKITVDRIDYNGSVFHNTFLEVKKRKRLELYEQIRKRMGCCCSPTRYEDVNKLIDELVNYEHQQTPQS